MPPIYKKPHLHIVARSDTPGLENLVEPEVLQAVFRISPAESCLCAGYPEDLSVKDVLLFPCWDLFLGILAPSLGLPGGACVVVFLKCRHPLAIGRAQKDLLQVVTAVVT